MTQRKPTPTYTAEFRERGIRSCWIHLSTLPKFAGPLQFDGDGISLRQGKTGRELYIPLTGRLATARRGFAGSSRPPDPMFPARSCNWHAVWATASGATTKQAQEQRE